MDQLAKRSPNTPDLDRQGRRRTLAPTALAQYLSLDSCDRYLRFYLYKGETQTLVRRLANIGLHQRRALQPFGPLMARLGDRVETGVIAGLRGQGYTVLDLAEQNFEATIEAVRATTGQTVYLYQAEISGGLGGWVFEGRADLLRVQRDAAGRLLIRVSDVKASRKDKVHHRLQVGVYAYLLRDKLAEAGEATLFEGSIIRRNLDSTLQDPETVAQFDLEPYYQAIDQLAIAPDSALNRVNATAFEDLHYYVNQKCQDCLFNPICMVESAERQDVALVPFLESADRRALALHGIHTVGQLAALKELPAKAAPDQPVNRHLKTHDQQQSLVSSLNETWPLGPKLDRLIQRAARTLNRLDPASDRPFYGYFFDSARSTLPDEAVYPDMVKIFLDAQTDYLEERVYLAGARIVGPKGVESVVQMTSGVADLDSERKLLVEWVGKIIAAVIKVAGDPAATPLHLYLYNRHDQRALLEALRRHLDVLATLPALYELLTETPALTQSAVSFLYDEVKEQRNLGSTGHTIQTVATQLGFKWNDGDLLYYRLFEQGMFDYLLKRSDTQRYIESAARFYSSIPLEYAYGAWGLFKAEQFKPNQQALVAPYLQVTTGQIQQFQAKRLEALAYIEQSFKFKNRFIHKEPLNLTALGTGLAGPPPFRQVLEEFLYIEHFANLQEHLQLFAQPVVRRVQQGRTLLVRCRGLEQTAYRGRQAFTAHFEAEFGGTGLVPAAALQLNKIKSGDFVVLNRLENDGRAWEIVRGRLCTVSRQEGSRLSLSLTDMSFFPVKGQPRSQPFRYPHDTKLLPETGELYSIDEMVDDLNGDRLLEGCRNADYNPFYHLMADPASNSHTRPVSMEVADRLREFASFVNELEGDHAPTVAQQAVIAGHLARRVLLVQGPPGTGKSHTLGWAVLARMYAERAGRQGSLRVAVCCQTHNAVNIVLQSIAAKLTRLNGTAPGQCLEGLRLYKSGGEETEENGLAGVEPLDPWESRRQLGQILNSSLVVIGATPGGLHKLMKEYNNRGTPETLWTRKPFDLVILDEASQMNLPQAVLSSAWLHPEGQLIVVGDHRQMSPILTHSWQEEDRLSAVASQPYRSVFQYLLDHQFPRVALDESFRLHKLQAEFLQEHIYRQDGINFHSRRQQRLPALNGPAHSAFVRAVLDPAYPVVVIWHDEHQSQQANPTEADLIAPIVTACLEDLGLNGSEGVGVVVPHRAQKALLRSRLPALALWEAVDTVERFQGDEREVIIVSATASDPDYVLAEAEFLLNPNRLNVALSRPRQKLIVVASQAVFSFLSADLEIFDQAVLWKRLLSRCNEPLWSGHQEGVKVKVFGCGA